MGKLRARDMRRASLYRFSPLIGPAAANLRMATCSRAKYPIFLARRIMILQRRICMFSFLVRRSRECAYFGLPVVVALMLALPSLSAAQSETEAAQSPA